MPFDNLLAHPKSQPCSSQTFRLAKRLDGFASADLGTLSVRGLER